MDRFITAAFLVATATLMFLGGAALGDDAHFIFPGWSKHIPPSADARAAMTIGDFNSNGVPDVALLCSNPARVTVLRGRSDGSLEEPVAFPTGMPLSNDSGIDMAVGDLVPDPDHLLDLVVVGGVVTILRNTGPPTYGFVVNETFSDSAAAGARVVTVGDFDGDGVPDIAHMGRYWAYVRFGHPSGWFGEPLGLYVVGEYGDLAADDLDGDGRCDLVVRHSYGLSVFHGTPNQNFDRREDYPQSFQGNIHKVVLADFNGDRRLDIAYSASQIIPMQVYVYFYYAREEGGFDPPQAIAVGTKTGNMAVGDVDGDGRMDLVAAPGSSYGGDNNIQEGVVLYSRGAGGFSSPVRFVSTHCQYSLGTADLDRDGRAEVLVVGGGRTDVAILRSRPRGLIATGRDYLVGTYPNALAADDFDQDGFSDLAVLNRDDGDVTVLWAVGDGSLERRGPDLHVGVSPRDIVAGYFDDDDVLDLCVTNQGSNSLTIWYGDGPSGGSFSTREFLYPTLPGGPSALLADRLDDDVRMDVAFLAGGKVVVLRGVPGGSLDADHPEQYTVASGAVDIVQADLNGDGLVDLATVSSQTISVLYGLGDGTFAAAQDYSITAASAWRIGAGDANGDGLVDLIASSDVVSTYYSYVTILYGQPGGGFGNLTRFNVGYESLGEIIVDDFDRDTLADVAVSGLHAQHIFFGRPDGTLVHEEYAHRMGNQSASNPMAVGDFDGDGRPDIASVRWNGAPVMYASVMLNQSNAKIRGDLAVTSVSAPSSGLTGDVVSVSWTVQNQLDAPITGKWTDAVYLSRDEEWDINDIRLGTLDFLGMLAGNGSDDDSYSQSLDVALPGVFEGDWFVLVRTDATDAVAETTGEADNVMVRPIAMQLPVLSVCEAGAPCPGTNDTFTALRRAIWYKVDVVAGEDLLVTLDAASTEGVNELYIRYDALPSRSIFDAKYQNGVAADQTARIPGTQAGTYYILAYADKLPMVGTGAFNIRAEYLPFELTGIDRNNGGNAGRLTTKLSGSGFTQNTAARLIGINGQIHGAVSLFFENKSALWPTFDLRGLALGTYDIQVEDNGVLETLTGAFTVTLGGGAIFNARLIAPERHFDRTNPEFDFFLEYSNTGNVDMDAPLLIIDGTQPIWLPGEPSSRTNQLQLMGIAFEGASDVLRPGAGEQIKLRSRATTHMTLRSILAANVESIDWAGLKSAVTPPGEDPSAWWGSDWDALVIHIGPTWGDYVRRCVDAVRWYQTTGLVENRVHPLFWYAVTVAVEGQPLAKASLYISGWLQLLAEIAMAVSIEAINDAYQQAHDQIDTSWGCSALIMRRVDVQTQWNNVRIKMMGNEDDPELNRAYQALEDLDTAIGQVYDQKCNGGPPPPPPPPGGNNQGGGTTTWISSWDPNDKLSPAGYGPSGFVGSQASIPYKVRFENLPAAGAAALKVEITDQLSPQLDWSTLQLDEIGFGGTIIEVPEGLNHYDGRVEMDGWTWADTNGWHRYDVNSNALVPLVVDVEAGIDMDTGVVHWAISCADRNTGNFPEDPFAGFLPPNQEEIFYADPDSPDPDNPRMIHPGEGYLTYSVRPNAGLTTGTPVTNKATIVFDWNAPIDTPTVLNTIDATAPTSAVAPLPGETPYDHFAVCWSGQDDPGGSGVETFTVYVSDEGGGYSTWETSDVNTCGVFSDARPGHTYRFYSAARDHTGQVEPAPADTNGAIIPDATITAHFAPFDFDGDGDVDLIDWAVFVDCLAGPDIAPNPTPATTAQECRAAFDSDADTDVDVVDYGAFQAAFTGNTGTTQLLQSAPAHEGTLWRTAKNVIRLTFDADIAPPKSGDIWMGQVLDGGAFGADVSTSFAVTVEDVDIGAGEMRPRVLRLQENGAVLTHRTWIEIHNLGAWAGVANFRVQYMVQVGDVNNDGKVLASDLSSIFPKIPTANAPDQERADVNGDGKVLASDLSAVFPHIPSAPVPKPSGH